MKVRAMKYVAYLSRQRNPGDEFELADAAHFDSTWMEPLTFSLEKGKGDDASRRPKEINKRGNVARGAGRSAKGRAKAKTKSTSNS